MKGEQDLSRQREEVLNALELGFQRVASRLLLATREGCPSDWRLLGRCVARVKRDLERYLDSIEEPEQLKQIVGILSFGPLLEAQIKASYLFARQHGYRLPGQGELEAQVRLLHQSSVASALAGRGQGEEV